MRARYVDPSRLLPAELEAWEELAAGAAQPNACADPAFVIPACRYLPGGSGARLLVVHDGPQWMACLPVLHASRWREVPRRAVSAWHHIYCTSTAPLLAASCAQEAAGGLLDYLMSRQRDGPPRPHILGMDEFPDGPAADALIGEASRRGLPVLVADRWERAAVHRRAHPDDYMSGLSSRRRSELRRRRRRLSEQIGAELVTVDRSCDLDAVEEFLKLEVSGWKGRAGTALACDPVHAAFFRSMCKGFRRAGHLQMWSLEGVPGKPVAIGCRLQSQDVLFAFKGAYDERYASLAPGVAAEVDAILTFHEREELSLIDTSTDRSNDLLNELYPDRLTVSDIAIGLGETVDGWLLALFPRLRELRRRLPLVVGGPAQRTERRAATSGGSISSVQGSL